MSVHFLYFPYYYTTQTTLISTIPSIPPPNILPPPRSFSIIIPSSTHTLSLSANSLARSLSSEIIKTEVNYIHNPSYLPLEWSAVLRPYQLRDFPLSPFFSPSSAKKNHEKSPDQPPEHPVHIHTPHMPPYEIRGGGDVKNKKQSVADLKYRRLTELNTRLREDLDRPRVKVSEAALS